MQGRVGRLLCRVFWTRWSGQRSIWSRTTDAGRLREIDQGSGGEQGAGSGVERSAEKIGRPNTLDVWPMVRNLIDIDSIVSATLR